MKSQLKKFANSLIVLAKEPVHVQFPAAGFSSPPFSVSGREGSGDHACIFHSLKLLPELLFKFPDFKIKGANLFRFPGISAFRQLFSCFVQAVKLLLKTPFLLFRIPPFLKDSSDHKSI